MEGLLRARQTTHSGQLHRPIALHRHKGPSTQRFITLKPHASVVQTMRQFINSLGHLLGEQQTKALEVS